MIFDLDPYNVTRLWVIFMCFIGVNFYFVFRNKILALDPKIYLMVFVSSMNAFCIERFLSLGGQDVVYFIVMGVWCNICLLLMPHDKLIPPPPRIEDRWLWVAVVACGVRLVISDIPHLIEFVQSGFVIAVTENRDTGALLSGSAIIQYIFNVSLLFFEGYCYPYNLFFSKKRWRRWVGLGGILMSIASGYLGGSRAAIFYTCLTLGQFLIYFRHELNLQRHWWRISRFAVLAVALFLAIMIVFSGIRSSDGNELHVDLDHGTDRVATRLFANADGIEYFLIFEPGMEVELYNFVRFNFVFILKRLTGEDYPNLGRRLYQSAIGRQVNYGGTNFSILLQSRVAFGWLGLVYIPFIVGLYYLSRHVCAIRGSLIDIYFYNLSYQMIWFFIESEAQFARGLTLTALFLPALAYSFFVSGRSLQFFPFVRQGPVLRGPNPRPPGAQRPSVMIR